MGMGMALDIRPTVPDALPGTRLTGSRNESEPSSEISVRELQPGEEKDWDRFVGSSDSGTFFHLTGWKQVIEKVLGHRCFYLAAYRDRQLSGIFPIAHVRSRLFGNCLVSLPLGVYGGICAEDPASYFKLLKAASDLGDHLGVKYLEMRNRTEPFPTSLPGRDLYVTFTQSLSPGPEKLFQNLPKKTRYEVRIGQKAGLEWVEEEPLDEFYEIYAHNVHRLGTPVFPKELFVQLRRALPGHWRLFLVRKGGRAIAGAFCWYFKGSVMPFYVGSLKEFYRDSPNNFMYWKLMEQSCREGLECFDFGRSKRGTGSFSFKTTWNMEMTQLPYRYQLVRAQEIPHLSPVDPKFQRPVAAWKRLPFALTKILGPRLIRSIPSV
jgi:FemAB-related protein (PEP-CTERM system-associated)